MTTTPLIIKDWQQAMAASPNEGHGLMRNVEVDVLSGALMPNYAPAAISAPASSATFTAVAATDLCTLGGAFAALANNVAVQLTTTGTLPAGLSLATNYFIIKKSATTFKLATCIKNVGAGFGTGFAEVDIDITDAGTGVHTITTVNVGTIGAVTSLNEPDFFIDGIPLILTFYIDTNGRVWFTDPYHYGTLSSVSTVPDQLLLLDGNSLTNPLGNGIGSFQTANINRRYVFTFRTLAMDVCDIRSITYMCDPVGSSAWTTAWQAVTGTNIGSQQMIVGDDNIMYFCNGHYVGSIQEIPTKTFLPSDGSTYTFNEQALTLPSSDVAFWLEQLGINLLVASGATNKIFPWDRSSSSFGLPIYCGERGVFRLKNINNTIFILNGKRGRIYKTQGAIVTEAGRLPEYATGYGSATQITWGGVGAKNGNLIFGAYCANNTANSGVWMLNQDGSTVIDSQPSSGAAAVAAIDSDSGQHYSLGYAGGVDKVGTTRQVSYGAVYQSALLIVGNKTAKAAFSQVEVQLNQPGAAGNQIRVSYRRGLSGSFTTLCTLTADGSVSSWNTDVGITDVENIQVQVELSGAGNNSDALQLMQVRLYP